MLKNRKQCIDKQKVFGALLSDLSKACDWISHKLLIAKRNVYGFYFNCWSDILAGIWIISGFFCLA